mmetsp:Transcript_55591/g.110412  ORF Transcript_55591/g.110412 Transcript_55591/m.110412 type:complete len:464 (-) Transcript_55591:116-1507(-)
MPPSTVSSRGGDDLVLESCPRRSYNYFESLISGRDMHGPILPSERLRAMFPAQVIKDAAMAHKVCSLLDAAPPRDKVLVICGVGHSGYGYGVPERIYAKQPALRGDGSFLIWCAEAKHPSLLAPSAADFGLCPSQRARAIHPPAADMIFACAIATDDAGNADIAGDAAAAARETSKAETRDAYNRVGETAGVRGDKEKALAVMTRLGYTAEQLRIAGDDAANFQGVSSPHRLAELTRGDHVLDLGSGLGIDSFIAAECVGPSGKVTGVDIAEAEVRHATLRAEARRLAPRLTFLVADLERLDGIPDASVDCVISNGAFCLTPDKPRAFAEVARVLRSGGRFAVATSTVKQALAADGHWPLCMRMFIQVNELAPICEGLGFRDVIVDRSDPLMQFSLESLETERSKVGGERIVADSALAPREPPEAQAGRQRNAVHVGSTEFDHLRGLDMNALCERVVVFGRKP